MLPAQKPAWLPLGALLVREELITNEQLETALIDQQGTGLRLGELLVQWGWVDSAAISRSLAEQYELEFVDLDTIEIDPKAVELLAARDARHYSAIPIRFRLRLGMRSCDRWTALPPRRRHSCRARPIASSTAPS